jgi:hypothetical protein
LIRKSKVHIYTNIQDLARLCFRIPFLWDFILTSTGNRTPTFRYNAISSSSNVKIFCKNVCTTFMLVARLYRIWKVFESKSDCGQIAILYCSTLTLILLTQTIWWAPNNAKK